MSAVHLLTSRTPRLKVTRQPRMRYDFASFYPTSYLPGRNILTWAGPLIAGLLLLSYRVGLLGLRHYTSTGS